jgi:RNA polymerase sigma-70 factor (ECF subfamily)
MCRRRKPAFAQLYREHAREVYDWFRRRTRDHESAADLTAETFARALQHYGRVRVEGGERTAMAWIFAIAHNVLREYRRTGRIHASARGRLGIRVDHEPQAEDIERRLSAEEARPELERALGELPADQRTTLRLRIVEELGYAEIAQRLSCSEPAARQRVARALATLKLELKGMKL